MAAVVCAYALANVYQPGPAEEEWRGDPFGRICEIASRPSQIESMSFALGRDARHMSSLNGAPIEPLTGIGRHPFAQVGCKLPVAMTNIFNISYLVLANHCQRAKPVTKFFDMGCTVYNEKKRMASASGSSIPMFKRLYSTGCITFDEIWGWESKQIPNWWNHVPVSARPSMHFYNTPVSAKEFSYALERCAESDLVIVKLDIDNTLVEMEIIEVIEARAHLIDELFFEYHYYFDGMDFGWGNLDAIRARHNVTSAIHLMTRLRHKGIRAHFWI